MRELKFRAWHRGCERSRCGGAEIPAGMVYPNPDRQSDVLKWLEEGQPVEVMQFTGLKDKNGVEIYEGDIVGGVLYKDYSEHVGRILFDFNGYRIVTEEKSMCLDLTEKLEVIGNIHQNPQILEIKYGR